jgi:hypothetical protein
MLTTRSRAAKAPPWASRVVSQVRNLDDAVVKTEDGEVDSVRTPWLSQWVARLALWCSGPVVHPMVCG